jgi:hypothetical protein
MRLRDLPLVERKRRLRRLIPRRSPFVLYLEHVDGRGREFFADVHRRDLEGIVAKWKRGDTPDEDPCSASRPASRERSVRSAAPKGRARREGLVEVARTCTLEHGMCTE